jgi:hypothetical protein
MRSYLWCVLLAGLCAAADRAQADIFTKQLERGAAIEDIRNEQSSFLVRVDVDHKDCVYAAGDLLQATVRSSRAGYLYLLYANAEGKVTCLFPNFVHTDNRIQANEDVQVPGPNANFRIRMGAPYGREVLKAFVSLKPLSVKELEFGANPEAQLRSVSEKGVRGAQVELKDSPVREWAEHQVVLTTVKERDASAVGKKASRYGVVIAIADYKDRGIPPLPACRKDAILMAKLFKERCGVSDMAILVDKDATRANIGKVFALLAQETKPGDEILIYWSGHGASIASTNKDRPGGTEALLVAYDTTREDPGKTGVLDEVMRRWIQDLDRRRMVFIIDACLAGAWAGNQKGLPQGEKPRAKKSIFEDLPQATHSLSEDPNAEAQSAPDAKGGVQFDFLTRELAQTKDIGQKETAVLASSTDKEVSVIYRDGQVSVMTKYLTEFVTDSGQPLLLKNVAEHVAVRVPEYVRKHYPGVTQHPQYVDHMSQPIYLRP